MRKKSNKLISIILAAALFIPSTWLVPVAIAETAETVVYHETFAAGPGVAQRSGGAELEHVSGKVFEGNEDGGALYVKDRKNDWDAADFYFDDLGLEDGHTYTVTVSVYVDQGVSVPSGARAFLKTADKNYEDLASAEYEAGEAVTLTKELTLDLSKGDDRLRVQSNGGGASVPFYIGEILITSRTASEPEPIRELIMSESFEEDIGDWTGNGAGNAERSNLIYRTGEYSFLVAGRSEGYHGPSLVLTDRLERGATYEISGYVRLAPDATEEAQVKMTMEQTGDNITDGEDRWKQIAGLQKVTAEDWVLVSGSYTFNPDAATIKLYFESDSPTVSFALDDFTIYKTANPPGEFEPVTIRSYDFDDGQLQGWGPRGDARVEPVTEASHDGTHSLKVTGRTAAWHGISIDLKGILQQGVTYRITGYVKAAAGEPESNMKFTVDQGNDSYQQVNPAVPVSDAAWVKLEGSYSFDSDHPQLILYAESDALNDFYLDSVTIVQTTPGEQPPRPPAKEFTTITFEDRAAGGFEPRGDTEVLTVTDEANRTPGGSYALKVEGREREWHGPSLRVEEYIDVGHEYKISVWVKLISPGSSQIQLSTQVGAGDGASYNNIQGRTISVEDDWVLFEGNYRYSSAGGEYVTIYVESSNNAAASFYIDDISFERTGSGPVDIERDLMPIKDVYEDYFLIGNAVSSKEFEGIRLELLKMHHNLVTAENAMKPGYAYNDDREFDFTAEDELVEQILDEGLLLHGHVLVWHQQSPNWLHTVVDANDNPVLDDDGNMMYLDRDVALDNLRTHVRTVVEHFGDQVVSWDVVNEAIIDNPPNPSDWRASLRQSGWYRAIGPDYIEEAFKTAKEVLKDNGWEDIKLYYNDYNDDNQSKAEAIYQMVKEINENYAAENDGELLIDGIGMQGHYNINTNPENVRLSLEKFISLGVEVGVTELDITAGSDNELTEKQANEQAYLYARLFQIYRTYADHISRVTFWGLEDGSSWRAAQSPLVFDKDYKAKPAYHAIIDPDKFIEEYEPSERDSRRTVALYGTPVIDGEIDEIWGRTVEIPIDQYQGAWQGANGVARALWDDEHLYVLVEVSNAELDKSSPNAWEQDSIEVFLDQRNDKATFYQEDDGQYRVNFDNETSFNPARIAEGFESMTKISGTNYAVEVKIPLTAITPSHNTELGFDVQINDGKDGARQSTAIWNDLTGTGFQDPSVFGVLTLKTELEDDDEDEDSGSVDRGRDRSTGSPPSTIDSRDGVVTLKPSVRTVNGRAVASITSGNLQNALEQAIPGADGKKQVIIELGGPTNAQSIELRLPANSLQGQGDFVLVIETGTATIEIPGNMLSNTHVDSSQVAIRITAASADHLDESVRDQIGDRPVIELNVIAGGNVIAWENHDAPVTVSIPYTPTSEERRNPDHIVVWYVDGEGHVTAVPNSRYDPQTGTVVFRTAHFSTYAITSVFKDFHDLDDVPWAREAIGAMAARDVIEGTDDSRYAPEASVTRADFVALLVKALELRGTGESVAMFDDVSGSAYFYDELIIAKELGIAVGIGDNKFDPLSDITRQDMMVLTARALASVGRPVEPGDPLDRYPDAPSIAGYATDSVAALVRSGIVLGKNNIIAPNDSLSRAEAAVILYRIWML